MFKVIDNAATIAKHFRRKVQAMRQAVRKGVRNAAIKINRKQIDFLSGNNNAAPGSYPVPNRTGNLMRSAGWAIEPVAPIAYVFNTAGYAVDIHEGTGGSERYQRRPFIDDAAEQVAVIDVMSQPIREALAVQ